MSPDNGEIARRLIATIADGDYEVAAEYLDADAEWHNTSVFPGPKTLIGADAIAEFWRDLFGTYSGETAAAGMEVEKLTDAGNVVVVLIHGWGRGQGSGIPIDTRWAHIFRFSGSKVIRVETHGHFAKALEAAGVSE